MRKGTKKQSGDVVRTFLAREYEDGRIEEIDDPDRSEGETVYVPSC